MLLMKRNETADEDTRGCAPRAERVSLHDRQRGFDTAWRLWGAILKVPTEGGELWMIN